MRITGGKYRGKFVAAKDEASLRPTTGYIREVIFNLLQHGKFQKREDFITDGEPLLIGQHVLDLFCGTGALGLEAISRGASYVTFIDQNQRTLAVTRENIRHLGEQANTQVICSNSVALPRAHQPVDLVLMDPPYDQKLPPLALISLRDNGWLRHGTVVVSEQSKKEDAVVPEGFILLEDRAHHKTRVAIFQFSEDLWKDRSTRRTRTASTQTEQPAVVV